MLVGGDKGFARTRDRHSVHIVQFDKVRMNYLCSKGVPSCESRELDEC